MKHKTAFLISINIALILFIVLPVALIFFVDPFRIYHKSFFEKSGYSSEQIYQHSGWIRRLLADPRLGYKTIILGSSTMSNYTQPLFDEKMPACGRVMNLSMLGSAPMMQAAAARYALAKNPQLTHVFWDLHAYYALDVADYDSMPKNPFPFYLYNDSVLDDIPYLFSTTNLVTSLNFLKGDFSGFATGEEDNGSWYQSLMSSGRFDVYTTAEFRRTLLPALMSRPELEIQSAETVKKYQYPAVDKNLLAVILPHCNSDIEIEIIFSPASRHSHASSEAVNYEYRQIYMRRYVLEKVERCKNIRVFAFDNIDWLAGDLTNYADTVHFKAYINAYILESIAADRNRLTGANVAEYERDFIANINRYKSQFTDELVHLEGAAKLTPSP